MLACPFCKNPYDSETMVDGRCPNCGGKLNWSSEEVDDSIDPGFTPNVTVSLGPSFLSRRGNKVEGKLASPVNVKPVELKISEDTVANNETISPSDSVDNEGLVENDTTSSKSKHRRSLSTDDIDRLGGIWKVASLETSNPMSTLRTAFEESSQSLDVVINERRFQDIPEAPMFSMDYEILKQIGQGAFGVVYSALQNSINRNVAVKMLNRTASQDEEQKDKFLFEAVVTGDLDHPNIVPIHELGKNQDGDLFYSMKQVVGTPWSDSLNKKSISENLEVLLKVCDAVSFAHAKGIVHRDLKPENTMLGQYGEVLVVDWGIALPFGNFSKMSDLLAKPGISGTPAYMAPEMATGPLSKIGPLSDVYLLGAILFEMITGKPPHRGSTVMDCVIAAADNHIVSTEESGELLQIAYRAMATEPKDRYASAAEFKAALHQYQSHLESISLADRAQAGFEEAKASGDYQEYAHAQFAFQEALDLWPQNQAAKDGLIAIKLSYAQRALEQGDFELGLSLIDTSDARFKSLERSLRAGLKAVQNRRAKVRKLVAVLIAGSLVSTFVFFSLFSRSQKSEKEANEQKQVAIEQKQVAIEQKKVAVIATEVAEGEKKNAVKATAAAVRATEVAEKEKRNAEDARIKLREKGIENQTDAYFFSLGSIRKNIDLNEFVQARRQLASSADATEGLGIRHCEWGLLKQVADGDYLQRFPLGEGTDTASTISAFSINKNRLATARRDGSVYIQDLGSLDGTTFDIASDSNVSNIITSVVPAISQTSTEVSDTWFVVGHQGIKGWIGWIDESLSKEVQVIKTELPDARISCLAVFGKTKLLVGFENGEIMVINQVASSNEGEVQWKADPRFTGEQFHIGGVLSCDFHPTDKTTFVTSGQDSKVLYFYEPKTEKDLKSSLKLKRFLAHKKPVHAVRFSSDGERVASAGEGRDVLLYEVSSFIDIDKNKVRDAGNSTFVRVGRHEDTVRTLQFSGAASVGGNANLRDEFLLSGGDDHRINLWSLANPKLMESEAGEIKPVRIFRGHGSPVELVSFALAGDKVNSVIPPSIFSFAGGFESEFFKWNVVHPAPWEDYPNQHPVLSTAISPDRKSLSLGMVGGFSTIDLESIPPEISQKFGIKLTMGAEKVTKEGHDYLVNQGLSIPQIGAMKDRELLVTSAGDNSTILWDNQRGIHIKKWEKTGRRDLLSVASESGAFATGTSVSAAADEDPESTLIKVFAPEMGEFPDRPLRLTYPRRLAIGNSQNRVDLTSISISPNGEWLSGGSSKGELFLWQVKSPNSPFRSWDVESLVVNIEFIPSGSGAKNEVQLLVTFRNGTVSRYSLEQSESEKKIKRLNESWNVIGSILKHCGGAGFQNQTGLRIQRKIIRAVYNASNQTSLYVIHETEAKEEVPSEVGRLEIISSNIYLGLLDIGGNILATKKIKDAKCSAAVFRPDNSGDIFLATKDFGVTSGTTTEWIKLWRTKDEKEGLSEFVNTGSNETVVNLGFPFSDRELLMVRSSGLALINFDSKMEFNKPKDNALKLLQGQASINCIDYSSDGRFLLTGGADGSAKIWDAKKWTPIRKFQRFEERKKSSKSIELEDWGEVTAVCFANQMQSVVVGTQKGGFSVFNRETGMLDWKIHERGELQTETDAKVQSGANSPRKVTSLKLSPGEKYLLVGWADGYVSVYDFVHQKEKVILEHPAAVRCMAFAANAELLICGADDNNAYIWKVEKWKVGIADTSILEFKTALSAPLRGHSSAVVCVEFSDDRTRALTASGDKTAKLWSLNGFLAAGDKNRKLLEVGTLAGHDSPLVSARFCNDGKSIVTTDRSSKSRLWLGSEVPASIGLSRVEIQVPQEKNSNRDGDNVVTRCLDPLAVVSSPSSKTLEGYELTIKILGSNGENDQSSKNPSHGFKLIWEFDKPTESPGQLSISQVGNEFQYTRFNQAAVTFAFLKKDTDSQQRVQFSKNASPDAVETLVRSGCIQVTQIGDLDFGKATEEREKDPLKEGEIANGNTRAGSQQNDGFNLTVAFRLRKNGANELDSKDNGPEIEIRSLVK